MALTVDTFKDKTVLVVGLTRTGLSAATGLKAGGANVLVWDDNAAKRAEVEGQGFTLADPSHASFDALILSPGIPLTHPVPHTSVARAKALSATITSDMDLLWSGHQDARYIGITGTNGKSTTTALIGHILAAANVPSAVGGNLGTAALDLASLGAEGTYVLETSSYQLDLISDLVFDVAILLNITPDHLDRHGGMDGYCRAKSRIFQNQTADQSAIISMDDAYCRAIAEPLFAQGRQRVVPISVSSPVDGGVYLAGDVLIDTLDGSPQPVMDITDANTLPGSHNAQNIAAAYAAARQEGIDRKTITDAICTFPGLPHRQHLTAEHEGIRFVNDSKATNAEAASRALACYDTIYWIAGGKEKEGGYGPLDPYLPNIRRAFLIGEAAGNIDRYLAGKVDAEVSGDLVTAVEQATDLARHEGKPGAVVLLSPACASFDQFSSFEARGDAFVAAVDAVLSKDGKVLS